MLRSVRLLVSLTVVAIGLLFAAPTAAQSTSPDEFQASRFDTLQGPGLFQVSRHDTIWFQRVWPGQMEKKDTIRIIRPGQPDEVRPVPPNLERFINTLLFRETLQIYHFTSITYVRVNRDSSYTSVEEPRKTALNVRRVKGIRVMHVDANGVIRDMTPPEWLPPTGKKPKR